MRDGVIKDARVNFHKRLDVAFLIRSSSFLSPPFGGDFFFPGGAPSGGGAHKRLPLTPVERPLNLVLGVAPSLGPTGLQCLNAQAGSKGPPLPNTLGRSS